MKIHRHFATLALVLLIGAVGGPVWAAPPAGQSPAAAVPAEDDGAYVPGASAIEGRIMAPCCWQQTIDIHASEVSSELRREIRQRLRKGETADAIEASLVQRYGQRILAVPPGSPLKKIALGLSVLLIAAGIGAVFLLRRWQRQSGAPAKGSSDAPAKRDEWDDRLDEELGKLER
jgi:cytochrome c-type biogenesis protein CcmH